MQILKGLLILVCATCLFAQADDPEVARAKAGIERLRSLVESGVAPRAQLEKAEAAVADAQDAALLRRTLYGSELNEDQAGDMVAAAQRRFDRRQAALDEGRKLVDNGVASMQSLSTFQDDVDLARKELTLAE